MESKKMTTESYITELTQLKSKVKRYEQYLNNCVTDTSTMDTMTLKGFNQGLSCALEIFKELFFSSK